MSKNKRPQMPKRRNFVAKNVNKVHRPQTFRDRTKYDRYEDYLKDQLDDYLDSDSDDLDPDKTEQRRKEEFKSKLKGEEYDPDGIANWDEYQYEQAEADIDRVIDQLAADMRDEIDKEVVDDMSDYINYDDYDD